MPFECSQCGECCSHLGLVFQIIEQRGDYAFLLRNQYTGATHQVSVSPGLYHLYDNRQIFEERPEACPLFRFNPDTGLYYCTVHLTRPDICREYGCWRFLITDGHGNRAGRIMGTRHLHTEDPGLRQLWDAEVALLHEDDDRIWDQKMCEIVRKAGFIVRS